MKLEITLLYFIFICLRRKLVGVVIHPVPNCTVTCQNALTWPLPDDRLVDYSLISVIISLHVPVPLIWIFPHFLSDALTRHLNTTFKKWHT